MEENCLGIELLEMTGMNREEVRSALRKIKNGKTAGLDEKGGKAMTDRVKRF